MDPQTSTNLPELIDHWVDAGIIDTTQAQRIRTDLAATAPRSTTARRTTVVAEALGYLGGVVVLVGVGVIVGWYWADLSTAARIALATAAAVALGGAGGFVPAGRSAAGMRLRSVLWAACSAAVLAALALVADRLHLWDSSAVLFAAGGSAVVSAVLWALHRHLPQHAVFLALLTATVAALASKISTNDALPGTAVLVLGVVWWVLSWRHLLPARTGMILGSAVALIGGVAIESYPWGTPVALATVVAAVVVAVLLRDLIALAVAAVGTLIVLPMVVDRYFPGPLSAALTLFAVGAVLIAAAVFVTRRRRAEPPHAHV